ncbi:MAG: DNA topoisomerase I [Desulfobacteraceae bacterium]|nr:MAG: DNA topoisomerase I [Desulfobacteraceae bacterium]
MSQNRKDLDPSYVRDQLDEILANEITALIDVDSDQAIMSYNLSTISCITLIVEREREIKQYKDFPPERYTIESFFNELLDIGLERDVNLENAVEKVLKAGFISKDKKAELHAEISAYTMVGFLNNMFPGMQGMNLIAYVLQMNEEVNSHRKSLEEAKTNFAQTLKSRGVSVTQEKAEKNAMELVRGVIRPHAQSKEISQKLKKANLDRLGRIMKKRKKRAQDTPSKMKIKDILDKGPSKEELEAQKAEIRKAEEEARRMAQLAQELAEKDEQVKEALEAAQEAQNQLKEFEQLEAQLEEAQKEASQARSLASELEQMQSEMAAKEAELKAMEERLKEEETKRREIEEKERLEALEKEQKEDTRSDDDIESMIEAFESELTMPCPLCKQGEITSQTTEKGKQFFSCTQEGCRFVSWDKPYHFECPLCKNSFLTETILPTGNAGLKCPRASCSYTQPNLLDPALNMSQAANGAAPKKKKKLVRRKKRR